MNPYFSMLIQWSGEDQAYLVSLPDFGPYCQTHGDSYGEAVKNGEEVLRMLIESAREKGEALPEAKVYRPVHAA
ncbi:MAG TPA: type II toxin-antitoxin system HicB family antitoxin [Gemmatales bacterium]|nr:type II toxin-antitoxin system HicB family antitoxin [Gemmatales bacterium]HMP16100.1 type II toxin-antitoxin system HicB family antitoxin [Gemmatales bacterium]